MRKICFLLAMLTSSLFAFSQHLDITYSNHIEKLKGGANFLFMDHVDENLVGIDYGKRGIVMKIYDASSLDFKREVVVIGKGAQLDGKFRFERAYVSGSEVIIFAQIIEKNSSAYQLMAQRYDKEGNAIGDVTVVVSSEFESKRASSEFMIWSNEAQDKYVIIRRETEAKGSDKKKVKPTYNIKVISNKLEPLSELSIEMESTIENFALLNYFITNSGNILLLTADKKEEKEKGEDRYNYQSMLINPKTGKVDKYNIELLGKDIIRPRVFIDEERKVAVLASFYADIKKNKVKGIHGVLYLMVDLSTGNVNVSKTKELSPEMIAKLMGQKKVSDKQAEKGVSLNYTFKEIIKSGDYYYVTSEYEHDYTVTNHQTGTTTYHYVRDNVLVFIVGKDGEINAVADVAKSQHTINDSGVALSYIALSDNNGNLMYIFNDHKKNVANDVRVFRDASTLRNSNKSVLTSMLLNPDGTISRTKISDARNAKVIAIVRHAKYLDESKGVVALPYITTIPQIPIIKRFISRKIGIMKISVQNE